MPYPVTVSEVTKIITPISAKCDVYVGGKVRVLELMRFFYLKHSGSKINFVL